MIEFKMDKKMINIFKSISLKFKRYRASWNLNKIHSNLNTNGTFCDLGPGDGFVLKRIFDLINKKGIGLDIVDLRECEIDLTLYDGMNIPFDDNSIDQFFAAFSLHHCSDPLIILKEAFRTLKPQSTIIILEDLLCSKWSYFVYHFFHKFLEKSEGISLQTIAWTKNTGLKKCKK